MPTGRTRRRCRRGEPRSLRRRLGPDRARSGRDRTIGAEGDIDMACFKRCHQGNARHLDVADDEGRHVQRAILDDDHRAVGLFEHEVVAIDLDVVDRDIGRKLHHVAGVGHIVIRAARGCPPQRRVCRSAGASLALTGAPLPTSTGTGSAAAGTGAARAAWATCICCRRAAIVFAGSRMLVPRIRKIVQFVIVRHSLNPSGISRKETGTASALQLSLNLLSYILTMQSSAFFTHGKPLTI